MKITIIAFGIARDILGKNSIEVNFNQGVKVSDIKNELLKKHPEFSKLKSLKLAVNEEYQEDGYSLSPNDEVVIIPPVSGG